MKLLTLIPLLLLGIGSGAIAQVKVAKHKQAESQSAHKIAKPEHSESVTDFFLHAIHDLTTNDTPAMEAKKVKVLVDLIKSSRKVGLNINSKALIDDSTPLGQTALMRVADAFCAYGAKESRRTPQQPYMEMPEWFSDAPEYATSERGDYSSQGWRWPKIDAISTVLYYLLNHPDTDVNAQDEHGRTVLHYAVDYADVDMVRLLMQRPSINTHLKDQDGKSALFYAITGQHKSKRALEVLSLMAGGQAACRGC